MMVAQQARSLLLIALFGCISFVPPGFAQDQGKKKDCNGEPNCKEQGPQVWRFTQPRMTRLTIELQGAPEKKGEPNNSMEPKAEPPRIRVDDRETVQVLLKGLSPLDVCSLNGRTPAATAETNVAESLAGTVAKLGGFAIGAATPRYQTMNASESQTAFAIRDRTRATLPKCTSGNVKEDKEFTAIEDAGDKFDCRAAQLIAGDAGIMDLEQDDAGACRPLLENPAPRNQAELIEKFDSAATTLADYAGKDYRGGNYKDFSPRDAQLKSVRALFEQSLPTIAQAGKLQALVDEMAAWAADLHKKFDYKAPAPDDGSPPQPSVIVPVAGATVVVATPAALAFTYPAKPEELTKAVHVFASGPGAKFTVAQSSGSSNWLKYELPKDASLDNGSLDLKVTVDPNGLGQAKSVAASFAISGAGQGAGTTIVNVTLKPAATVIPCDLEFLTWVDERIDRAKAVMSLISDNNKTLETAQATLKANYLSLTKVYDDYVRRRDLLKVVYENNNQLVQKFDLATDRKNTITANVSCVSDTDGKTPTTDAINFSVLYQNVPNWSASAGLLTSFLARNTIGVVSVANVGNTFQVIDHARAQLVPMAFVNYRFATLGRTYYGGAKPGEKEDELIWTMHGSAGLGVNPNSGANQPEFFLGLGIGFNRFMIHPGVHFGRTQSLGGGYTIGSAAPGSTTPINWSYHPAFSIGFSVRLAPY
jgi:hypothetical protein